MSCLMKNSAMSIVVTFPLIPLLATVFLMASTVGQFATQATHRRVKP